MHQRLYLFVFLFLFFLSVIKHIAFIFFFIVILINILFIFFLKSLLSSSSFFFQLKAELTSIGNAATGVQSPQAAKQLVSMFVKYSDDEHFLEIAAVLKVRDDVASFA